MKKNKSKISRVLKKLLFERNIKAAELSRKINISKPTIHRIITDKSTRPYDSSLQPIAKYFSITLDQLLGNEDIPSLENKFDSTEQNKIINIPVIPWNELDEKNVKDKRYAKSILVGNVSSSSFATIMNDFSMDPLLSKNSILIFDPQVQPVDRGYVLIKSNNNFFVRQLIIDTNCTYIKSINTDLSASRMLPLKSGKDKIVATLIESRCQHTIETTLARTSK